MHAAYQADVANLSVSIKSVYNKLNGIEPPTSAALVAYSVESMGPIVTQMGGALPPSMPGYRLKIVDGNCLGATQHRLDELRVLSSGALPGKSLVVYDPALQMATQAICCEDGHAQERALFDQVLSLVEANEVWLADRNFCTRGFLGGIEARSAYFIIRHHQNLPWEEASVLIEQGRIDTGVVYEQRIRVWDEDGGSHLWRRIVLKLDQPTREGETQIVILTNLPKRSASAQKIARLYRQRWTIERAFQELAEHLNAEINTLGYPPAALFAFCLALVAYNLLAVVKAALGSARKLLSRISGRVGIFPFRSGSSSIDVKSGNRIQEGQGWHLVSSGRMTRSRNGKYGPFTRRYRKKTVAAMRRWKRPDWGTVASSMSPVLSAAAAARSNAPKRNWSGCPRTTPKIESVVRGRVARRPQRRRRQWSAIYAPSCSIAPRGIPCRWTCCGPT